MDGIEKGAEPRVCTMHKLRNPYISNTADIALRFNYEGQ